MRLLTRSKIYRAFPELDPYPDDRCLKFVQAARGTRWRKARHALVIGFVSLLSLAAGFTALGFAVRAYERSIGTFAERGPTWAVAAFVTGLVLAVAVGPFAGILTRDRLLSRRVRHVLRARGTCAGCGYSLVGLPVRDGVNVRCSECGLECEVDESLGELVRDDIGQTTFRPSAEGLRVGPRWLTPVRAKKLKKAAIWTAILLPLLLLTLAGSYEIALRVQAAAAARERPGAQALLDHVEKVQPAGTSDTDPNAWDVFYRADRLMRQIDTQVKGDGVRNSKGDEVYLDLSSIYSPYTPLSNEPDPDAEEQHRLSREWGLRLMAACRSSELYPILDEMAACRRAVRPINLSPTNPAIGMVLPELGRARQMARLTSARMSLARQDHDPVEFRRAMEVGLTLARMCQQQVFIIEWLVGVAIESLTYSQVRIALMNSPDRAWLDEIRRGLDAQVPGPSVRHALEGECLGGLDTIAWFFSDPNRARPGRFSPALQALSGGGFALNSLSDLWPPPPALGWYGTNRDVYRALMEQAASFSDKPPWQREDADRPEADQIKLPLVELLAVSLRTVTSADLLNLERLGVRTMLALESFRLQRGDYPRTLSELVPEFLNELPIDPWSGRPLGFKRIDPAADTQHRAYLLYSVGRDGEDDHGIPVAKPAVAQESLFRDDRPGTDFILNDAER